GSVVVSREPNDEPVVNACVWIDGELIRLHRPGALESEAVDINSDGDVLTNETVLVDGATAQSTPVLWERDAHMGIYTPLDIRSEVMDIPDMAQRSLDGRALNDHQSMIITAVQIEPFQFAIYSVSWGIVN